MRKLVLFFLVGLLQSSFVIAKPCRFKLCGLDSVLLAKSVPRQLDSVSAMRWGRSLLEKLRADGYWTASFDSLCFRDTVLIAYFYAGTKWQGGVEFVDLTDSANDKPLISPQTFSERQYAILSDLANNGYPFAKLFFDSVDLNSRTLRLKARIDKGRQIRYQSIQFKGAVRCDSLFWYAWTDLHPGCVFNNKTIEEVCYRIEETGFAQCAAEPELQFVSDSALAILILLQKNPSGQFDGLLGVAQNKETKQTELTGSVSLLLKNSLHMAETIGLQWQRPQQNRLTLQINYNQQFILGSKFGIDGLLAIERTDTLQMTTSKRVAFYYAIQPKTSVYIYGSNKASSLLSTALGDSVQLANSSFTCFGIGLQSHNLDYVFNPSRGYEFRAETGNGSKWYELRDSSERISQLEARLDAATYLPLSPRLLCLKLACKSQLFHSSRLFYNEFYFWGGNKTLRGFLDDQLRASFYAVFTLELRFLFAKNSNFYVFFDQASYKNRFIADKSQLQPYGLGAGVSLRSKNNIFTLCYAVGGNWQTAPEFMRGKVHFGFVTLF